MDFVHDKNCYLGVMEIIPRVAPFSMGFSAGHCLGHSRCQWPPWQRWQWAGLPRQWEVETMAKAASSGCFPWWQIGILTLLTRRHLKWQPVPDSALFTNPMSPVDLMLFKEKYGEGNGIPFQYSCLENPMDGGAWWAAIHGVAKSQPWLSDFTFNFHFPALEKEMATHSGGLAWRIPGTGEPGGLPSVGSHRVGHDWSDLAAAAAAKKNRSIILSRETEEFSSAFKIHEFPHSCIHEEYFYILENLVNWYQYLNWFYLFIFF